MKFSALDIAISRRHAKKVRTGWDGVVDVVKFTAPSTYTCMHPRARREKTTGQQPSGTGKEVEKERVEDEGEKCETAPTITGYRSY